METAPDSPGIGALPSNAESLPDVEADSLPGVEADSLPRSDESDPEVVSLVVPVPGEMRDGDDLPRDRKDDLPGTCCARSCIHRIETECAAELREWRTLKDKLPNYDVHDFIFKLLLVMGGVGEAPLSRFRFKLFGQYVCRTGFRDCIGIGNSKLNRLLSWLKEGHMQPPRDLRHSSATERSRARDECDAALQRAYDILAESINSSDVHPADHDVDASAPELKLKPDADDPEFLAMPTLDGFCEWVHGPGATVTSAAADAGEVKWLPPMALIDLFELCEENMRSSASYITFFRCYVETWQQHVKDHAV